MESKEQLEYELTDKYLELRDGRAWRKEYVNKRGRVMKARPAKSTVNSDGYILIWVGGKYLPEGRVIFMLAHKRPIKEGYQIDHRNLNKTDNSISNLRELSHRENCQNKQVHLNGNQVGGSKFRNGWRAYIRVNGKQYHLGTFKTQEQAHAQYRKAEKFINYYPEIIQHLTAKTLRRFLAPPKVFLENDDN